MKIRLGFVSNSSSSSFLAYGAYIAEEKVEELGESGLKGLKYWCPGDGERFVGISWDKVGDDETGQQFKNRVAKLMAECFGENIKCGTGEYAWSDY